MRLSVEQIKEKAKSIISVKYVRVGERDFRFAQPEGYLQHSDLVKKGETPVSAGFFIYFHHEIIVQDMPSTTLDLGPLPEDKNLLMELFDEYVYTSRNY